MKVLYIGGLKRDDGTKKNSYFEYLALKKIYKNIEQLNPDNFFIIPSISKRIFYHLSPKIIEPLLNYFFLSRIKKNYDLIYVNSTSASYIGKKLIKNLKKRCNKIITLINDNPYSDRDKKRWKLYLESATLYDLTAAYNQSRISMGKKIGIKNILLLNPPYQKNIHNKKKISNKQKKIISNDIIVIATWFPERGIFFKKLIEKGLDIKIYGNRWDKDKNFSYIKSNIILGHVDHPNYSKLIQCAKISICLPSKGNFDGITRRSIEIPAIGTFLLAKKTHDHKRIFLENKEAVFFDNVNDCYKKCIYYLRNSKLRNKIAKKGYIKVTKILKSDYETLTRTFIKNVKF